MPNLTHKELFTLINDLIDSKLVYPATEDWGNQLSRSQVDNSGAFSSMSSDSFEILNTITELLEDLIPPRVKSGLVVSETDPISNKVKVTAGSGVVGSKIYTLNSDVEILIPSTTDTITSVYYITLFINGVQLELSPSPSRLTLAKVIVPQPGTTNLVYNDKGDGNNWDAYIINHKEMVLYGNDKGVMEDDTVDLIKDNSREIAAETIIGTLTLDEGMTITNVAGSLKLDSNSLKIFDTSDNLLSKFNNRGVYFYNTSGIEMARFTNIDARIGNIIINTNSIASENFASGALGSGFQILDSGDAEFNNVSIRGKMTASVFEKETISAIGGNLLVMDADILDEDMTALDASLLVISGDTTFSVGDILRIKDGVDDEWFEVTGTNGTNYTVTRDKASQYTSDSNPIWKKGTAVVNYGVSSEGGIFMTASESNAPYISIFKHAGSPWSATTTVLRLGNLNGFLGYSSDLYGIAIGTTNDYLKYDPTNGLQIKGSITITGGNASVTFYQASEPSGEGEKDGDFWIDTDNDNVTYVYDSGSWVEIASTGITDANGMINVPATPSGSGLYLGSSYMGYYSGSEWKSYIQSNGDFLFKGDNDNYVEWDGADLTVRGTLNADDINVGTLSGITIQGNTIQTAASGSRVLMNSDRFIAYDDSSGGGLEVFKIILANPGDGEFEGDVIIGDYANNKGVRWNASADTFHIKGDITATSGNFSGTVTVGSAGKVYIDGENQVIKVYDDSSNLMVELGQLL